MSRVQGACLLALAACTMGLSRAEAVDDGWSISSGPIDPKNYFGATVANGMIGIVSSPRPFHNAQTIIYGAYEKFQLWDVDNCIVSSFDFLDLDCRIDGTRIDRLEAVSDFRQDLDIRHAALITAFKFRDKAEVTDEKEIHRNLEYYNDRGRQRDPSPMTNPFLAIDYVRLGEPERAYQVFEDTLKPIRRPPFGGLAEYSTTTNPYFATGAGASLQTMLYGFAGLEITDKGLAQRPVKLPAAWKSLTLTGVGPNKQTIVIR